MDNDLLNGIATLLLMTGLMAIPWIIIGRIIGNREDSVSGKPRAHFWHLGANQEANNPEQNPQDELQA